MRLFGNHLKYTERPLPQYPPVNDTPVVQPINETGIPLAQYPSNEASMDRPVNDSQPQELTEDQQRKISNISSVSSDSGVEINSNRMSVVDPPITQLGELDVLSPSNQEYSSDTNLDSTASDSSSAHRTTKTKRRSRPSGPRLSVISVSGGKVECKLETGKKDLTFVFGVEDMRPDDIANRFTTDNLISPSNAELVLELLKDLDRQLKESPDIIPVIDNSLISSTGSPGHHRMMKKDETSSGPVVCDLSTSSVGSIASNPDPETGKPPGEELSLPQSEESAPPPPAPAPVEKENKPSRKISRFLVSPVVVGDNVKSPDEDKSKDKDEEQGDELSEIRTEDNSGNTSATSGGEHNKLSQQNSVDNMNRTATIAELQQKLTQLTCQPTEMCNTPPAQSSHPPTPQIQSSYDGYIQSLSQKLAHLVNGASSPQSTVHSTCSNSGSGRATAADVVRPLPSDDEVVLPSASNNTNTTTGNSLIHVAQGFTHQGVPLRLNGAEGSMGPPQHILVQSVPLTYVDTSGVQLGQQGVPGSGAPPQALFVANNPPEQVVVDHSSSSIIVQSIPPSGKLQDVSLSTKDKDDRKPPGRTPAVDLHDLEQELAKILPPSETVGPHPPGASSLRETGKDSPVITSSVHTNNSTGKNSPTVLDDSLARQDEDYHTNPPYIVNGIDEERKGRFSVVKHPNLSSLLTDPTSAQTVHVTSHPISPNSMNPPVLPTAKRRKSSVGASFKRLRQQLEQQTTDAAIKKKTRRSGIDLIKLTPPEPTSLLGGNTSMLGQNPLMRWCSDNHLIQEQPRVVTPRKISLNIASVLSRSSSHEPCTADVLRARLQSGLNSLTHSHLTHGHEPKELLKAKFKIVASSPAIIYLPDNVYHTIHHEPSRYRRRIPVTPFSDLSPPVFPLPRTRSWTDVSETLEHQRRLSRRDPFYTHYENKYLESLEDEPGPHDRSYPARDLQSHFTHASVEYSPPHVDHYTPLEEYRPLERTLEEYRPLERYHRLLPNRTESEECPAPSTSHLNVPTDYNISNSTNSSNSANRAVTADSSCEQLKQLLKRQQMELEKLQQRHREEIEALCRNIGIGCALPPPPPTVSRHTLYTLQFPQQGASQPSHGSSNGQGSLEGYSTAPQSPEQTRAGSPDCTAGLIYRPTASVVQCAPNGNTPPPLYSQPPPLRFVYGQTNSVRLPPDPNPNPAPPR
uniref:Serine/threonine-protein kinase WNK CCTL2 domain-containing protein n=1 Tax=Cacopsylla melanoneura TaxID=428564 RepID=A0A8D8W709_9HEMI